MAGSARCGLADRAAEDFRNYRGGDEIALGRLVSSVTPLLWHTARGLGLDAASAEDVVQETWVALYRSAHSIDSPQAVLQWLLTTTRRGAISAARKADKVPVTDPADPDRPRQDPVSEEPGPEAIIIERERESAIWRAVQQLSKRCQFLLRVVAMGERPDYAAIANALGMRVGSIGPTRGRCLARLRTRLEADAQWRETP